MSTINDSGKELFDQLIGIIQQQQALINDIATKIEQIESIGGGGTASINDYESGVVYKRNTLVVDTTTETVYRVLSEYTSVTVQQDCANKFLKLVGFESQFIPFSHDPTDDEIQTLPDDAVVVVYNPTDNPYIPSE